MGIGVKRRMSHQVVGYIRVSSQGQNTARQLADIKLDKEFVDMVTGSNKDREGLKECLAYVREGDQLVIDSIDRLARNLQDLQEIVGNLVKKGVSVKFIKENLTFTGKEDALANLMLQMMGAFAEFERTMIRSRQREGIIAAKKAGKHLGRPIKTTKKLTGEAKELKSMGTSIRQIAFKLNVSRATVYKMLAV
jgi:DNA invertase Pin-like site-specific DNA recombinase